jgi:LPXTG-site transpeptidase (sortase) family protein
MTVPRIKTDTTPTGANAPVVRHRVRFWLGITLMVIGIAGVAFPFLSFGLSRDGGVLLESMPDQAASGSAPVEQPKRITDRLLIAGQDIDMPLLAWKDGEAALYTGAWLWPDGSRPGQVGNTIIFGHRFRYLPPLSNTLFKLDDVAIGDSITVQWKGTDYSYRVTGTRVIDPTDLSVLAPSTQEQITIITCTPVFSTKQRLVVTAIRQ